MDGFRIQMKEVRRTTGGGVPEGGVIEGDVIQLTLEEMIEGQWVVTGSQDLNWEIRGPRNFRRSHRGPTATFDTTDLPPGRYTAHVKSAAREFSEIKEMTINPRAEFKIQMKELPAGGVTEGDVIQLTLEERTDRNRWVEPRGRQNLIWEIRGPINFPLSQRGPTATFDTTDVPPGRYTAHVEFPETTLPPKESDPITVNPRAVAKGDILPVTMRRAFVPPTSDQALWTVIRNSTEALSFNNFSRFMEFVLCGEQPKDDEEKRLAGRLKVPEALHSRSGIRLPFPDVDAYRQLKIATEVFMMVNCGANVDFTALEGESLDIEQRRYQRAVQPGGIEQYWRQLLKQGADLIEQGKPATLPYLALIRNKLRDVQLVTRRSNSLPPIWSEEEAATECYGIIMSKLTNPCFLELIWSYWHEEGMLVQTMNAITWRFQNRPGPSERDPLALLEIDPLRPLNNFLWGYIQDEQHRLTVPRRAYEYDHHYGLTLLGKAVPPVRGADSRNRFLEAFHNLLMLCSVFYKEDDDTTVVADGFPVLNALKEVHLLLTQGAHNQYGDLPWTARQEMLMQEWLLARPEFREFLPRRIMVDYPEEWMDSVETMKTLQGWASSSILHFRDLGVHGEKILLGARFSPWPSIIEPERAANWARYWRPEIQGYIHAYRAVTGVDLTARVDATPPALLLQNRLASQRLEAPQRLIAAQRAIAGQRVRR
jgi:hypothetical protein